MRKTNRVEEGEVSRDKSKTPALVWNIHRVTTEDSAACWLQLGRELSQQESYPQSWPTSRRQRALEVSERTKEKRYALELGIPPGTVTLT
jgi:hypothetical protein